MDSPEIDSLSKYSRGNTYSSRKPMGNIFDTYQDPSYRENDPDYSERRDLRINSAKDRTSSGESQQLVCMYNVFVSSGRPFTIRLSWKWSVNRLKFFGSITVDPIRLHI